MASLGINWSARQKFPNDPIFTQFAKFSKIVPGVIIHDEYGIDASYGSLLNDIVQLRHDLRQRLPIDSFDSQGLLKAETGAIASITVSAYYFVVAFLAIAALGGKCVPLRKCIEYACIELSQEMHI
jgi:malonyl-CoA/methylmalonyl-CoA synthetase